ncbi:MAG: hypothetical protein AB7O32_00515 [Vicinamibacterales bacterium]
MAMVRACLTMLPKITAAESLLAAARVGVGAGRLVPADSEQLRRAWQETADATATSMTPRQGASASALRRRGLKVRRVASVLPESERRRG